MRHLIVTARQKAATQKPVPFLASPRQDEAGFLLMGTGVLILVIIALLSSFAFVNNRNARFQANFAAGQRLAEMAPLAHFSAQQSAYGVPNIITPIDQVLYSSTASSGNLMSFPDNFRFNNVANVRYTLEIVGSTLAPVNNTASFRAASAYLHVRLRTPVGTTIAPSDRIALQSGANSRGMNRVGFYQQNIVAGDICDQGTATAGPAVVRWGPELSSCLNANHIGAGAGKIAFTDLQPGDIIVPVWETALAKSKDDVIYRYPQPERPDVNIMTTTLNMANNPITGADNTQVDQQLDAPGDVNMNNMAVRNGVGTQLTFNQKATINRPANGSDPFRVVAPSGMNVSGPVTFHNDLSVANTIGNSVGTMALNVNVVNPVSITTLEGKAPNGSSPVALDVQPLSGPSTIFASENSLASLGSMVVTGGDLGVTGNMDVKAPTLSAINLAPLNIYASQMVTKNTVGTPAGSYTANTQIQNIFGGAINWQVGSIEQTGSGTNQGLYMDIMDAQIRCDGHACPDQQTQPPGGGL